MFIINIFPKSKTLTRTDWNGIHCHYQHLIFSLFLLSLYKSCLRIRFLSSRRTWNSKVVSVLNILLICNSLVLCSFFSILHITCITIMHVHKANVKLFEMAAVPDRRNYNTFHNFEAAWTSRQGRFINFSDNFEFIIIIF